MLRILITGNDLDMVEERRQVARTIGKLTTTSLTVSNVSALKLKVTIHDDVDLSGLDEALAQLGCYWEPAA